MTGEEHASKAGSRDVGTAPTAFPYEEVLLILNDSGSQPFAHVEAAERMLLERRRRNMLLGEGLFGEPAWDLLLELYVQTARGIRLQISTLCTAAGVPATTALRWIKHLAGKGWLDRGEYPNDLRMIQVTLTAGAVSRLDDYFASLLPSDQGR